MDWLKAILGETEYNKLVENGTIAILKKRLGENEYIQNDPLKVVPKGVFNEKNEDNKLLKTQIEEYKKMIKNQGDLITDGEMKAKLAEQELNFKTQIETIENTYKKEKEITEKTGLIKDALIAEGCQYPDLIIKQLNLDDLIVKDGIILNHDKVILPVKETYKSIFDKKITGKPPIVGDKPTPPINPTREDLIKKHDMLQSKGDFVGVQKIRREIQNLDKE